MCTCDIKQKKTEMPGTPVFFVTLLFVGTMCAPQVNLRNPNPVLSTINMSYEDLDYIVKFRSGQVHAKPRTLSPCARAILGCCNGKIMNSNCSESLQCGAFFFDENPCEDRFVEDALKAAKAFYEQSNKLPR
uniref:Uncharacterized protein n=1 Tax=Bombyx mori TaxID=7091 RepID=A0A8R2AK79_BOMMO|nr:uncharacterized protein LOC101736265 [Bombyx mori]